MALQYQSSASENFDKLKHEWVRDQVTSVLYGNALGAIVGNMFNISLVSYLLLEIYPESWLAVWFAAGLAINVFRLFLYLSYKKNGSSQSSVRWLTIYRITTLASGIHFGLLALFFFSSDAPLYQTLVAFLVGGSVAAAVGTHGVDGVTYKLFMFPSALALFARAAYEGTEIHSALAVMVLFLVLVMLRCASQTQRTMLDNIQMSYSLNYRATHDPLVALLNREEFKNEFEKARLLDANKDKTAALVFIDLDNFKHVNDTHGHEAGDKTLIAVSEIIRSCIRKSDVAARFGGDEFILLLNVSSLDEAFMVCDKILRAITFAKDQLVGAEKLGASLGVGYTANKNVEFDLLLKTADRACYVAKSKGKGRVCALDAEAPETTKTA